MKASTKRIAGIGISLVILAGLGFFFTAPAHPQLPDWIAKVKPFEFQEWDRSIRFPVETRLIYEVRRLPMSLAQFRARMNNELSGKSEWRETSRTSARPAWGRFAGTDTIALWVVPEDDNVIVHTNWAHQPTWVERAGRDFRSFFGFK